MIVFAGEPGPVAHAWAITALVHAFREETAARLTLVLVAAPSTVQVYDDLWANRRARQDEAPVS